MQAGFLLNGATGYTGELMARAAIQSGLRPILAGSNIAALKKMADELSLMYRTFGLDDPEVLDAGITGVNVVLNCAGPFTYTAQLQVHGGRNKSVVK